MNLAGLAVALFAIFCIWFGHIWVRRLLRYGGRKLWPISFALGSLTIIPSFLISETVLSAFLAILSATFFWSIKELFDHDKRKRPRG